MTRFTARARLAACVLTAASDVATGSARARAASAGCESRVRTLLDALAQRAPWSDQAIAAMFDALSRTARSLPSTNQVAGFARNWSNAARRDWEQGERGAAFVQISVLGKKLGL
jgi:hypothetical protein